MRGAERPAKIHWTHPFLPPLIPLSDAAARQTFVEIADDFHDDAEINQVLGLTDNMPLAVDLIAHLVDLEGCANVLTRWETEKTSLLSKGYDRRSNLDASITISLTSPRITSLPDSQDLLVLLSVLPDGLSDIDLLHAKLPILNPLGCKAALIATSLAYIDDRRRLKSLVPIREHIQLFYPAPPASLIRPLQKHFYSYLVLVQEKASQTPAIFNQITSNLGNLQTILLRGLHSENPDITETIRCTVYLNRFSRISGRGRAVLMDRILSALPQPPNHQLEAEYIHEEIASAGRSGIQNPELLINQAIINFQHIDDPVLECEFSLILWEFAFSFNHSNHQ